MTYTTTIAIIRKDADGRDFELEVEVQGDVSRYVPAKTTGPPEDCHPAEGGTVEDITPVSWDLTGWIAERPPAECGCRVWRDGLPPKPATLELTADERDQAAEGILEEANDDGPDPDDDYDERGAQW